MDIHEEKFNELVGAYRQSYLSSDKELKEIRLTKSNKEILDTIKKSRNARDLQHKNWYLLFYNTHAITSVIRGLANLYNEDLDLLSQVGQEQAIMTDLCMYIRDNLYRDFADAPRVRVDCEYTKHGKDTKKLNGKKIVPDMIIHRMYEDSENLIAVECKQNKSLSEKDIAKLKGLTLLDGEYGYLAGIGLELYPDDYNLRIFLDGEEISDKDFKK